MAHFELIPRQLCQAENSIKESSCHTLEIAPFLTPARVRVERKQDLASILNELFLSCREAHCYEEGAIGCWRPVEGGQNALGQMKSKMHRRRVLSKCVSSDWLQSRVISRDFSSGRPTIVPVHPESGHLLPSHTKTWALITLFLRSTYLLAYMQHGRQMDQREL
jgi:hypothetical protein